jgi:hypothetical protein
MVWISPVSECVHCGCVDQDQCSIASTSAAS